MYHRAKSITLAKFPPFDRKTTHLSKEIATALTHSLLLQPRNDVRYVVFVFVETTGFNKTSKQRSQ